MPRLAGIDAISQLRQDNPDVRILVLTSLSDEEMACRAIKQGALGYLLKTSTPEQLYQAIHSVYLGELALSPSFAHGVLSDGEGRLAQG